MRVSEFAEQWLEHFPRPAERTNETYRQMVSRFVAQHGRRRLDSITLEQARAYAVAEPAHARFVGLMFADALTLDLCPRNPFERVRVRKPPAPASWRRKAPLESQVWEAAEVARNELGPIRGDTFRTMILTAAYTGVRASELCALTPADVIRRNGIPVALEVVRQRHADGRITPPKGGHESRAPILPPIREEFECQLERAAAGWWPCLFVNTFGKPFTRQTIHRWWAGVRCHVEGLEDAPWHALRHFTATHLLDQGGQTHDVAIALRHRDGGRLVQERYGHPDHDRARDRLEALYG